MAADTRAEMFELLLPEESACLQVVCEITQCYSPASARTVRLADVGSAGGLPWHLSMTLYLDVSGDERATLRHQIDTLAIAHGGRVGGDGELQFALGDRQAA